MDSLASHDPNFKNYVESVLSSDNCKACQAVCYGVSKTRQRFALILVYNLYYYVYMVIEPIGDGICMEPVVPYASFNNKDSAIAYMKEKGSEWPSKQKIGDLSDFDKFVTEKLKPIWGRELYRIHDFDTQGNPFIIVLKKWFIYYRVVIFTNLNDEPQITSKFDREEAEIDFVQHKRNALKGIGETYELFYRINVGKKWLNFDQTPPESAEEMQLLTANNYISDTILKDKPDFAAFVEKSVLSSFRGEEVYRKYGVTHAGQHFCYVVSKVDYYIVHVVLEPSSGVYDVDMTQVILHSLTWLLTKVKERAVVDKFVARDIKQFVDQSGRSLLFEKVHMYCQRESFSIENEEQLEFLELILRRGEHLRRNLNVGLFSPTYHDGIYLGNGKVAHYTTDNSAGFFRSKGESGPGIVSLKTFLHGENTLTIQYRRCLSRSREQVAQVAEHLIRNKFWDRRYNLLRRNCQLFADLCTISTAGYKLEHGAYVDEFKTIAKYILLLTFLFISMGTFGWYIYDVDQKSALCSIIVAGLSSLLAIGGFIVSSITGALWWIQKKSLEKTLQIFVELENSMALGVSTEEGYENLFVITEDE